MPYRRDEYSLIGSLRRRYPEAVSANAVYRNWEWWLSFQEIQHLRGQIVQVESQLRTVLSPNYAPHDRERAVQEQNVSFKYFFYTDKKKSVHSVFPALSFCTVISHPYSSTVIALSTALLISPLKHNLNLSRVYSFDCCVKNSSLQIVDV